MSSPPPPPPRFVKVVGGLPSFLKSRKGLKRYLGGGGRSGRKKYSFIILEGGTEIFIIQK